VQVAITGASGLIGTALADLLRTEGHQVIPIVRHRPVATGEVAWEPSSGQIDAAALEGFDAVVHLAGEGIASHRWSAEQKQRIERSRVEGTELLSKTLAGLDAPPRVLLSASATGIYGDRGSEVFTEASPPAHTFLARVCQAWEAATTPASDAGVRVAHLRSGLVLTHRGGALSKLLPLFRLGLGGRLGSGRQFWSWISLEDEVRAIRWLIDHEVSGPVNMVSPSPTTNAQMVRALAAALHRPAVLPIPAFGPRLVLGRELADELLFTSARVVPTALDSNGYTFRHPDLDSALQAALAS
jgi:uncharacterized protein (TIGR01777 family)